MAKTIETRTETITLGEDGILRCKVKPVDNHTLDDEHVEARRGEARGEARPRRSPADDDHVVGVLHAPRGYHDRESPCVRRRAKTPRPAAAGPW